MNLKIKLPTVLYRGDSDFLNIRKLRSTIHHNQYQTNLINGGEGRTIFEMPLVNLINDHVGIGWEKTHFLSFSEDLNVSYKYGSRNGLITTQVIENNYSEYFEDDDKWSFVLLSLHTDKINWTKVGEGIYEGLYDPILSLFRVKNIKYRVLLIDVKTILSKWKDFDDYYVQAYLNATMDKEWLVLPATKIEIRKNEFEYSSILDGAALSYKKIIKAS